MATVLVAAITALAAVGITLGILSSRSRRRFAQQRGAFRCRVRLPWLRGRAGRRWPRPTQAVWVADVLLIQSGRLRLSVAPVAAHVARSVSVEEQDPVRVRSLGTQPLSLLMTDQLGHPVVVAVAASDRALLVGPFLTVAAPGVPGAPLDEETGA